MSIPYQLEIFCKYPTQSFLSKLIISIKSEYNIDLHIPSKSSVDDISKLINDLLKNPEKYPKSVESYISNEEFIITPDDVRAAVSPEMYEYLVKTKQITNVVNLTNIVDMETEVVESSDTSDTSDSNTESSEDDSEDSETSEEIEETVELDLEELEVSSSESEESESYE